MVFCKSQLSSFAATALLAVAQASYLANDLSFGHVGGKISPNLRAIPNFHITGNPNPPEILSNKLILTPPAPGNQRGAIWAEKPLKNSEWTADIDFRTTGPERGGGNLQIWYTKDGQSAIGTSSIYTAGKFDGLALVIDQYSGSGGFIRGFLNDGSTTYKDHHSVDSLAFGHCEYSYRNLGRPSRISVKHHSDTFRVEVDGRVCFDSHKVKLPLGYQFGISAASTENPDSFEVFKFVVTTESHTPDVHETEQVGSQQILQDTIPDSQNAQAQRPPPVQQSQPNQQNQVGDIPSFSDPPEVPASSIKSNDAQFADLHNRLQAMMKHIGALNREISSYQNEAREKNSQLSTQITLLSSSLEKLDGLKAMEKKLDHITYDLKQTKSDLHNSLDRHVAGVKSVVGDHHENLMANVVASAPSIVAYTIVVLASQGLLILAFLLYKRRKANGPKKYL